MNRKLNFNACEFVKREQNQIGLHKKPFLENTIKPNKPMGAFGRQFVTVSATKFFCNDALGSFVLIDSVITLNKRLPGNFLLNSFILHLTAWSFQENLL